MSRLLRFNKSYFLIAAALLVIEVLIAQYLHDRVIRPYIGDLLVVILIYTFIKSWFRLPVFKTAMAVLAFAFLTETLQYFNVVRRLGLQHSKLARIVIGTSFEWTDFLAYTGGIAIVLIFEYTVSKRQAAGWNR